MGSEGPMAATTQKESVGQLQLPRGFRFHPTDEELVLHYLCPKAESQPFSIQIIADVDIYKFDPWNLPEKAVHGESEWYFFSPRDRKYPNGSRPNRAAGSGYWKATGTDKHITCAVEGADGPCQVKKLGVKKALVFYKGRAPNGTKTNWIMHEYRLADGATCNSSSAPTSRRVHRKGSLRLDDWVLCRIYKKKSSSSSSSMVASDSKQEEEKAESFREESGVDSIIVEEFLASLPEIEASKLGQLHLLPKLEGHNELSPHMKHYQQSTGSGVMDHRPADLFEHGYPVDLRRE